MPSKFRYCRHCGALLKWNPDIGGWQAMPGGEYGAFECVQRFGAGHEPREETRS